MNSHQRARCLIFTALVACCGAALATERVNRRFDSTTGLSVSTIFSLTQDAEGFIWIGTAGGLLRYDGNQMRPWAKDVINRDVFTLAAGPHGEILVAQGVGTLYRVTANGVDPVLGLEGKHFEKTLHATFDGAGRLWVVTRGGVVHVRDQNNSWRLIETANIFQGQLVHRVVPATNNRIYFLTGSAIWESRDGETPRSIFTVRRPMRIVEHPNGSLFVLTWVTNGEVIELRDGRASSRVTIHGRPIDLVVRGNVIWASFDRYLVSIRADEPPDIISPEHDLPSGGPLLVDHEGSLWLGTYSSLIQYPEPETLRWNESDGLPSAHLRLLAKTEEGVWAFSWQGLGRVSREGNVWRVRDEKLLSSLPCQDANGMLILGTANGMVERRGGRFVPHSSWDIGTGVEGCAVVSDGTVVFATNDGLYRDRPGNLPEQLDSPTANNRRVGIFRVFEDKSGRLWVGRSDGNVCHAASSTILAGQPASWSCQTLPNLPDMFDLVQLPSGSLWMSTNRAGVWRYAADKWEPIPASKALASQMVFSLTPSQSGGVWVMGHGTLMRVLERPETAEGWEVAEVVSLWEGLTGGTESADLIEDPDGRLWCANSSGLNSVPPEARRAEAAPPKVKIVDIVLNGRSVTDDEFRSSRELPFGSQVELHFAALSYRDRSRLRYQYRLRPDAQWTDSRDNAPVLRFVDLSKGGYQAEVRASLDGVNWTPEPARFGFQVLSPWYLRPITLLIFGTVAAVLLYAFYRARVRALMRLQRQRAQIAMDLHDEMGSGLGSIGILSSLASQDNVDANSRKDLAVKIADTAGELGSSLAEIVWALKPGTTKLEGLAYHLAERGGRLFPSHEPHFTTKFPDQWPTVELSLAVRRNLMLITTEALHNAARHSQAKQITFGLEPARGRRWRLWVADNGCGLEKSGDTHGSGFGLTNMRRRAQEIGAELSCSSNNGYGTIVSVVFDPRAQDRRVE